MSLNILLARRISGRLADEARLLRRALRDHQRQETARIRRLEFRSRGLRLYASWAAKGTAKVMKTHADDWHRATLLQTAGQIAVKTPSVV